MVRGIGSWSDGKADRGAVVTIEEEGIVISDVSEIESVTVPAESRGARFFANQIDQAVRAHIHRSRSVTSYFKSS